MVLVFYKLNSAIESGEHGDAGGYAATGISSTSRSMSGYQHLKMALSSPFSVRTRVCNNTCAPSLDHCICCWLLLDSGVVIGQLLRNSLFSHAFHEGRGRCRGIV